MLPKLIIKPLLHFLSLLLVFPSPLHALFFSHFCRFLGFYCKNSAERMQNHFLCKCKIAEPGHSVPIPVRGYDKQNTVSLLDRG